MGCTTMSRGGTVRIGEQASQWLKELAERSGQSQTAILDHAIEAYRRQQFLDEANAAFAALRSNRQAWQQEQTERQGWDATLDDDLEDD